MAWFGFLIKSKCWREDSQKHLTQLLFPSLSLLSWNIYIWMRLKMTQSTICNPQVTCPYPLADSKRCINLQLPTAKGSSSSGNEESIFYSVAVWDKLWGQQCLCIWSSFGEARSISLNWPCFLFNFHLSVIEAGSELCREKKKKLCTQITCTYKPTIHVFLKGILKTPWIPAQDSSLNIVEVSDSSSSNYMHLWRSVKKPKQDEWTGLPLGSHW